MKYTRAIPSTIMAPSSSKTFKGSLGSTLFIWLWSLCHWVSSYPSNYIFHCSPAFSQSRFFTILSTHHVHDHASTYKAFGHVLLMGNALFVPLYSYKSSPFFKAHMKSILPHQTFPVSHRPCDLQFLPNYVALDYTIPCLAVYLFHICRPGCLFQLWAPWDRIHDVVTIISLAPS